MSHPEEGCEPLAVWQSFHNPSCLKFHEIDLNEEDTDDRVLTKYINSGSYRDVFMITEFDGTQRALKMLAAWNDNEFDLKNFERHRQDAVAFEQLSASPTVADIFGYCSNSAFHEFSHEGDLKSHLYTEVGKVRTEESLLPSKEERLIIARDAAAALADFHHFDSKGRATMAHTDIKPNQFILLDGRYKLNDFNRIKFLTWNKERNEQCGFEYSKAPGRVRQFSAVRQLWVPAWSSAY